MFSPLQKDHCKKCTTLDWVNNDGVCEDCSTTKEVDSFRTATMCKTCADEHTRLCTECKKPTDVYVEGSMLCPKCAASDGTVVNCHGCGTPFLPKTKYGSTFCTTCFSSVKKGKCVECKKLSKTLDNSGRCDYCADAETE